jgi:hypothetical protein
MIGFLHVLWAQEQAPHVAREIGTLFGLEI